MKLTTFLLLTAPLLSCASQIPMSPHNNNNDEIRLNSGKPSLSDLLTLQSSSSIFFTYARETELSQLFTQETGEGGVSVLVPTNKAVMALSRKPHESEVDPRIRITEAAFEKLSKENVRRWISAHIIPVSPLEFSSESRSYDTLLPGKSVTFQRKEGEGKGAWRGVTVDEKFKIIDAKQASNGYLYIVDGTVDSRDSQAF